jgi:phytanoyl-CoA hydroxylase
MLSPTEREAFERDGYFVRPGVLDEGTVDTLRARLSTLIERCAGEHLSGARPTLEFWEILRRSQHDASVCWDTSRGPMPGRAQDWEPFALRVGHGLHLVDELFGAIAQLPGIGGTLAELTPEAVIAQSAVVYKQPHSDLVQFGAHQDAAYITTEPESLVLAFLALDDADAENGALQVAPGTHREPLHVTLKMEPDGFVPAHGKVPREQDYEPTLLPMRRGSVAFVHGRAIHASGPNRADRPRRALIIHAISRSSKLAPTCWFQPPPEGFTPLPSTSSST